MKLILENWRKYLSEKEEPFQKGVLQLFIPRACPGEKCQPQKLASAPEITNGPSSLNKPRGGIWTSTANKAESGAWTSAWNDWMKHGMPHWMHPKGILLKVGPNAKIFHINTKNDVLALAKEFPRDEGKEIGGGYSLGAGPSIDFEAALKTYDGIHWGNYKGQQAVTGFGRDNMWDVESTVWRPDAFGSVLIEEGVVDVEQVEYEDGGEHAPWETEEWTAKTMKLLTPESRGSDLSEQ